MPIRSRRKYAQGIPTDYQGVSFRSKLEGRWAVFLDLENITWQYEPRQYRLSNGVFYTPDFWLPQVKMFIEIKPDEFASDELEKCYLLHKDTSYPVILVTGEPINKLFEATDGNYYSVSGYHQYHIGERRLFSNGDEPLEDTTITEHAEFAASYRFGKGQTK